MSKQKLNKIQQELFNEWVQKDKELQASFPPLKGATLSTRRVAPSRKLFEEYKIKIMEAGNIE